MAEKSKKYLAALEKVNREQLYNANEALELVKEIDIRWIRCIYRSCIPSRSRP